MLWACTQGLCLVVRCGEDFAPQHLPIVFPQACFLSRSKHGMPLRG